MRWPDDLASLSKITAAARRVDAGLRDRWFAAVRAWLGRDGLPNSPRRPTQAELADAIAAADEAMSVAARPIPMRFGDPPRATRIHPWRGSVEPARSMRSR